MRTVRHFQDEQQVDVDGHPRQQVSSVFPLGKEQLRRGMDFPEEKVKVEVKVNVER